MVRVNFRKGNSRKFLDNVKLNLRVRSLRDILQFGVETTTSCLKNYSLGRRLMPDKLFQELCRLAKINPRDWNIEYLDENWGKVKGGKTLKKKRVKKKV